MIMNKRIDNNNLFIIAIYFLIILFISIIVFMVFMQIHGVHFEALVRGAFGVLEGKPYWIAYQNRLLGPVIVYLISQIGGAFSEALFVYFFLIILVQNAVLFLLLRSVNVSYRNSMVWVILYSIAFIWVQDVWFYTWDSIDAIVFTFFAWGILQAKPTYFFIFLFIIGIFNRESALFIALYIALDSFHLSPIKPRFFLTSKLKFITGSFLFLSGIAYTKIVRDYLFISKTNGMDDKSHELIGNHIYITQNLRDLFFDNIFSINIINSLFLIGATIYLIYFIRLYTDAQIKALIIYCVILSNIIIFGLINEARMYIVLFPFIIFLVISKNNKMPIASTLAK